MSNDIVMVMALEYHKPIKIRLASYWVLPYHLPTLSSPWHMHHKPSPGYLVKVGGTGSPTPQCFSLNARGECNNFWGEELGGRASNPAPALIKKLEFRIDRLGGREKKSHCLSVQTVYFQQECTCVSPYFPLGQTLEVNLV